MSDHGNLMSVSTPVVGAPCGATRDQRPQDAVLSAVRFVKRWVDQDVRRTIARLEAGPMVALQLGLLFRVTSCCGGRIGGSVPPECHADWVESDAR